MKITFKKSVYIIILSVLFTTFIAVKTFKWFLVDFLTPFINIFIIVYLILMLILILIVLIILINNKQWITIMIATIICLLMIILPIDSYAESARFHILQSKMEQTALNTIRGDYGKLSDDNNVDVLSLPDSLHNLSRGGGDVLVFHNADKSAVFFFTYRGLIDNFSGYVYLTDLNAKYLLKNYSDWIQIIQIDQHWFFYCST